MAEATRQSELFSKLVTLADGDARLVREALRRSAHGKDAADLDDVLSFIESRRQRTGQEGQPAAAA